METRAMNKQEIVKSMRDDLWNWIINCFAINEINSHLKYAILLFAFEFYRIFALIIIYDSESLSCPKFEKFIKF